MLNQTAKPSYTSTTKSPTLPTHVSNPTTLKVESRNIAISCHQLPHDQKISSGRHHGVQSSNYFKVNQIETPMFRPSQSHCPIYHTQKSICLTKYSPWSGIVHQQIQPELNNQYFIHVYTSLHLLKHKKKSNIVQYPLK